MSRKSNELFPFMGKMVSAHYIAKYYGIEGSDQAILKRLRNGATVKEAISGLDKRNSYYTQITGGIMPHDIQELKEKIHVGDTLKVKVEYININQNNNITSTRNEVCKVTGVYKHLITLQRLCGLTVSKTYVDLIQEGIVL